MKKYLKKRKWNYATPLYTDKKTIPNHIHVPPYRNFDVHSSTHNFFLKYKKKVNQTRSRLRLFSENNVPINFLKTKSEKAVASFLQEEKKLSRTHPLWRGHFLFLYPPHRHFYDKKMNFQGQMDTQSAKTLSECTICIHLFEINRR